MSAAEALPESHWITRHVLGALPAADKLRLRIAYGEMRARVLRPLRDSRATRGSDAERLALEHYVHWVRTLRSDDVTLLASLSGAEGLLIDLFRERGWLSPSEAIAFEHALGIVARFSAAMRPLAAASRTDMRDLPAMPPALTDVTNESARCQLILATAMECFSDADCVADLRDFWVVRLLTDSVELDGAMARNPTWPTELRGLFERAEVRDALARGDVAMVEAKIADPRAFLSEPDRARYRRLLSFSATTGPQQEEAFPERAQPAPKLRSSSESAWIAIEGNAEIARAKTLSEVLERALSLGFDDPLLVWLPADERSNAAA